MVGSLTHTVHLSLHEKRSSFKGKNDGAGSGEIMETLVWGCGAGAGRGAGAHGTGAGAG